ATEPPVPPLAVAPPLAGPPPPPEAPVPAALPPVPAPGPASSLPQALVRPPSDSKRANAAERRTPRTKTDSQCISCVAAEDMLIAPSRTPALQPSSQGEASARDNPPTTPPEALGDHLEAQLHASGAAERTDRNAELALQSTRTIQPRNRSSGSVPVPAIVRPSRLIKFTAYSCQPPLPAATATKRSRRGTAVR